MAAPTATQMIAATRSMMAVAMTAIEGVDDTATTNTVC